ncbi:uncharacterized protein LOC125858665 [Solanum stenotomum]|uniref:uncharacterized protein LOC125858665 n=1 Tax=Solanum stenotomum TaxID=172797 RepID=UPI0020CFEEF2|nr:uncharacterized protein LOC125858665 [Solanum stenotomum]
MASEPVMATNDPDKENRQRDNKKKDAKALVFIQHAVHDNVFSRIATATTSKQAWSILQKEFQGDSKVIVVRLQSLRLDFETLMVRSGESIASFLSRAMTIARINRSVEKNEEKAFQVKDATTKYGDNNGPVSRGRGRRGFCGGRDRSYRRGRGRNNGHRQSNEQGNIKNDVQCHHCHRYGHIKADWAKSMFRDLDEKQKKKVQLGNTKEMQLEGKCKVAVDTIHDKVKMLDDVPFVPDLGFNLLSVGQLMGNGYSLLFDDDVCVITNKKSGKKTKSLGGSRYFLLFTDDYSHMSWVYFLENKSENLKSFRNLKLWWKTKVAAVSKFFAQIEEESSCPRNSICFVKKVVSIGS